MCGQSNSDPECAEVKHITPPVKLPSGGDGGHACDSKHKSVLCIQPSDMTQIFPLLPLNPIPDPFSCPEGECLMAPPPGWRTVGKESYDYHRVDWISVTIDAANIVTGIALMLCVPTGGGACVVAAASETVAIIGEVYSFSSAQNNQDLAKATASTVFDQSELVRAIPFVGIEYSFLDAIYNIDKGRYSMPTWQYAGP